MGKRQLCLAAVAGALIATTSAIASRTAQGEFQWWHETIGVTKQVMRDADFAEGIRIGILDGLAQWSHPEFRNRLDSTWTFSDGTYTAFDNHGTHVSGIASAQRDKIGMAGVATKAWISNVAVFDDHGWAPGASTRRGLKWVALDGATSANLSYGPNPRFFPGLLAFDEDLEGISRYRKRMVVAKAAGNSGVSLKSITWNTDTDPLYNLIIVGSATSGKDISAFSNRPGSGCFKRQGRTCREQDRYWNHFLLAPGEIILSTLPTDRYGHFSGTSMAAPMVAGAAALLQARWPFLETDPKKTAEILLDTAEDLGKKTVYGRGLLRVDLAMQPQGTTSIPVGATVSGAGHASTGSSLQLAAALGGGSALLNALEGAVVFDRYGRDFEFDPRALLFRSLSNRLLPARFFERRTDTESRLVAMPLVNGLDATMTFTGAMPVGQGTSLSRQLAPEVSATRYLAADPASPWHVGGELGTFSFGVGQRMGLARDLTASDGLFLLDSAEAAQPFAALGEHSLHSFGRYQIAERLAIGLGFAEMGPGERMLPTADGSGRAYLMQADFRPMERIGFQVTQSLLEENRMTLGGVSTGAFALGSGARTLASGAAVSFDLPASIGAGFHFTHGTTAAEQGHASLFRQVSTLRSRSYGASLTRSGVLSADDEIGLAVNRPLHVTSGTAILETPVGRTLDGRVKYRRQEVSLAPEGNQTDFDVAYRAILSPSLSVGLNLFYQHELNHEPGAWNAGGLTRLRLTF